MHTLKPAADYMPKMGKKQLSLLAVGVEADMPRDLAIQTVRQAWMNAVVNHTRDGLAADIAKQLADIVETFEMMNGSRPVSEEPGLADVAVAQGAWDSDMDDAVSEGFDLAFWAAVGPSGQVELTTDTRADLPERRKDLGQRLAGGIIVTGDWLVLSDADAGAILDANPPKAAKVGTPDERNTLAKALGILNPQPTVGTAQHPQTGISYESAWQTGVKLVREALAAGSHDYLTIGDELELCIDSDDILGTAGAQRLSPSSTPEVVRACMQILAGKPAANGEDWKEALVMAALDDEAPHPITPTERQATDLGVPKADAEQRAPAERQTPAQQTASASIAHEVMTRYIALAGLSEQAMADILGCSRGMINAAAKGRKQIDWTPERVSALKSAALDFATSVDAFREEVGAL